MTLAWSSGTTNANPKVMAKGVAKARPLEAIRSLKEEKARVERQPERLAAPTEPGLAQ